MKQIFNKLFKESMLGAVTISTSILFIGLLYLIPYLENEQAKKDAFSESQRLSSYIRMFRSYYNSDILSKIKEHTDLEVNFDHRSDKNTVPLPATVVHDLGQLFTDGSTVSVQMYSNYPFPNRDSRVLDTFQKDSLAFVLKNPDKSYSKEELKNGQRVFRTSFPDFLSANSCVNCHNTRADTPKNDWKLGDIRGVIEVSVPLEAKTSSSIGLTSSILLFILVNFIILALYYFIQMRSKNKKLEKDFTDKDKILSEYKRAVDLGAIVSKTNQHGLITYVNKEFINISGYSKRELIGKKHSLVKHPDTDPKIFTQLWQTIQKKQVWQGDLANLAKDGTTYNVNVTIVPILDAENEITEFLAIRYNTTELHKAIKRASNAEKAKSDFLANMSHELRTPLNAIIGFSQILQRRKELQEKEKNYVDKIQLAGQNLLTLVNSILDFSKIEEGKMECHIESLNISQLFTEITTLVEHQAQEKEISLDVSGFTQNDMMMGDKQLLKQAFINILSNAVKFTPKNGHIKILYTLENKKHIFNICDDGVGISKEDISTLFTPFKQGQSAKKSATKGTGLGLAITHKIITELHRGEIDVQSEEEKGTCFKISL